ncbi:hypothetical protein ARMSODRAFT_1080422 [Armillaria solidipes]|uniref:DUF6534 domain-containing protein n=1 Tax=Armillaria solidipes TaxID=1076256 RepID=A0A2H3C0D9_9AGAR|nr:hypothetical protein ARMSODRAFT_1080422 [Armillaria solidipes]
MQPVPAGYPIAELSGPHILGCLLNWGLFGALSVQQIVSNGFSLDLYYLAFPNDRRFTKYLVYGIYVIEFVQTMLVAHDAFATFGYGFGDMDALTGMNFFWLAGPIMSAVGSCVGQVFYAHRIFIVSKSRIIPIFILCVSLTSSAVTMMIGIGNYKVGNITKLNNRKTCIAVGISCGTAALCDILIAICMTYYASSFFLSLMRSTTNFRRTRMLVTNIIRVTIETGSVTAVVALLSSVLFIAFPHQAFFMTPYSLVSTLYANCVYIVLNSRFQIIGGRDDTYTSPTDMSITTTMIRNITSQLAEGTRPVDGIQGREPVVAMISHEAFDETAQIRDKPQDTCMVLSA